jgi:hypothetical protein
MWTLPVEHQGDPVHKLPAFTLPTVQGGQDIQMTRTYPKCHPWSGASRRPSYLGLFSSCRSIIHKARRSCNRAQVHTQSSALLPKVIDIREGLPSTLVFRLCATTFLLLQAATEKLIHTLSLASFVHAMAQWLTVFEKRRTVSLAPWNTPYLESNDAVGEDDDQTCHRFGEEDEEEDQADRDEEWSEIRKFMGEGLAQADKAVDFCRGSGAGASLASLRSGNVKAAIQKNAWLDERSGEDARQDAGPLTALDLYRKLKKQVRCPQIEILCHVRQRLISLALSGLGTQPSLCKPQPK